ncbi:MAG TPA: hypothetical protein VL049_01235, partial [Candidatus Dormibacteraeota bacterium]|nr:hypothetical protein [Candidatus Dormibacteraeota bacterium]
HGTPLMLAMWGDFGAAAARCQRALGLAATQCALDVWTLRRACIGARLHGQPCDANATTLAVRDARQRALDKADAFCADDQVTALKFVDRQEALSDVTSICRQLERELITGVYGPGLVGSSADYVVGEVDPARAACLDAAAARATELLRFAAREQRTPFDRIASQAMAPEEKFAVVARGEQRARRARASVAARAAATCDAAAFSDLSGRTVAQFLADVGSRADCLVGGVYVQDRLRCPAPVCGNGMEEAGEECDDGNADDTDTCRADCVRTDCPVFPTTFDLLQEAIFDSHGCSDDQCHGEARAGGLDLRLGDAYDEIVGVPSAVGALARIEPGDPEHSRLWLLLAKATLGRDDVEGRAMPIDLPALSADELKALRLWIAAGARRTGTVAGTGALLHACLPAPLAATGGNAAARR